MKKDYSHPEKTCIEISLTGIESEMDVDRMIFFIKAITKGKEKTYAFINTNGYWLNDRNVFPDRACVGWMLYIPSILLPELIPEAARVVPVMCEGKQKGTIVVSTEDVFDGNNKEHIGKANDIEIRLVELGFLPLMTEL